MTNKNRSTLERAAGIIEGVASVTNEKVSDIISFGGGRTGSILQRKPDSRKLSACALQRSCRLLFDGKNDNQLPTVEDYLSAEEKPQTPRMESVLQMV